MSDMSYESLSSEMDDAVFIDLDAAMTSNYDTMRASSDFVPSIAMSQSSDLSAMTSSSDLEDEVTSYICSIAPKQETEICFTCYDVITDQYYMRAGHHVWHEECLRCCVCQINLDGYSSCFVRDNNIFCRKDYMRIFEIRCSSCSLPIESRDWVRSAGQHVYHLACFACSTCQRQLSTGEDFAIHDGRVMCRIHALNPDTDNFTRQPKSKRFRTAFTDEQTAVLQKYFDLDTNPTGSDLDLIARESGLARRVAQVWFQNARAKAKKNNH